MKEGIEARGGDIIWYRLRGLGLVSLCSLVFFVGAYLNNRRSLLAVDAVSGNRIPLCSVQTEEKKVALTFNTVWEGGGVQEILDTLAAHQVRATFFVTGEWAQACPDELKEIAQAGHDVASCGMRYADMSRMTRAQIQEELLEAQRTVEELTGRPMELFRPPYGKCSSALLEAAESSGYRTVQWDVDSEDWKDYGTDAIIAQVTQKDGLGNGSIVLMHSDAKYTPQALDAVIRGLQEQGYEAVPVSEMIGR